jgi:hypothetical protein
MTLNHIGIQMGASAGVSGMASHIYAANAAAISQFTLLFNLTSASVVELTGSGTGSFLLSGPGFSASSFGQPVTLNAGSYELEALVEASVPITSPIFGTTFFFDNLNLSADFTSVPEPKWAFVVPIALLLMLWRPRRAGRPIRVAEKESSL